MGQTNTKPIETRRSSSSVSSKRTFNPRKHLTRIELVSLQYIFNDLKSAFKDNFECIEPKSFLVRQCSQVFKGKKSSFVHMKVYRNICNCLLK